MVLKNALGRVVCSCGLSSGLGNGPLKLEWSGEPPVPVVFRSSPAMDLFGTFWSHLAVVLEGSFRDPVRGHGIVPHGCGPSLFGVYAGMILVARAGMLGRNRGATEQQHRSRFRNLYRISWR